MRRDDVDDEAEQESATSSITNPGGDRIGLHTETKDKMMADTIDSEQAEARTPWVAPVVDTMSAGDAEVGFNRTSDGPNSSS